MKYVCIVTGGTGGHIYPALAYADALKNADSNIKITFIGSKDRMESKVIPQHNYDFIGLDLKIPNGSIIHKASSALYLLKAYFFMLSFFKKQHYDLVVGFGNYIEFPVCKAAYACHIPYMLHEQNSFMGKANLQLAKQSRAVITSYDNTSQYNGNNVYHYGNPQASKAALLLDSKPLTYQQLGFKYDYPVVTIVMGSLGSDSINHLLINAIDLFSKRNINYIIVTGTNGYHLYANLPNYDNIIIKEAIDGISCYHASNLVVSRAGATACSELLALAKPSILIPSPYVPNDHQTKNAQVALDNKAAILIKEKELTVQLLDNKINEIVFDKQLLLQMSDNALKLAKNNAADDMVKLSMEVING